MKQVDIYTDGACSGNPGPGGWACVLVYKGVQKELSGYEAETTNNQMELEGAIRGLRALTEPCAVDVYTDSAYLCQAFRNGWLKNWKRNGWTKANGKDPVLNRDRWEELDRLCSIHSVSWHKVKGHSTNRLNNRCDELATGEIAAHTGRKRRG